MLPKKKERQRSGIERAPRRYWPKHEQWVRGHQCCVGNDECSDRIQFAHVRVDSAGGTGLKPASWHGISLCEFHHIHVQHNIGHEAFDKRYGIDSRKLAAEFAAKSTDTAMKEVLRQVRDQGDEK